MALMKAILTHLYIAWIHPFGDGNGRTARLAELQILLAAGMPMPASHLLSNHYNTTRTDLYRQPA
jgi:Fic family protein